MVLMLLLPETYGPVLLVKRAQRIRRLDPKANVVAPHELEAADLHQLAVRVLTRPMRMLFFELIVSATCVYLALCYGIFYMTFQAYPIIFQEMYGLSPGVEGLCFLPIGAGALCALPVFFSWDAYLEKAQAEGRPWTKKEEYRRVPLACIGGPLFVISLFWLGWTSREGIPFWVPMLAGIPFGCGFQLIFMALVCSPSPMWHKLDILVRLTVGVCDTAELHNRCLRDLRRIRQRRCLMHSIRPRHCAPIRLHAHVPASRDRGCVFPPRRPELSGLHHSFHLYMEG